MKKLAHFFKQHVVIFSILTILVTMAVMLFFNNLVFKIDPNDIESVNGLPGIFCQIAAILAIPLVAYKFVPISEILFRNKNFGRAMLLGWFIILLTAMFTVSNILDMRSPEFRLRHLGVMPIVYAVFQSFLIGTYEELLLRGVILNTMIGKYGTTKKGVYKAVIFSALLFGAAHMLNLLKTPNMPVTILIQVVYASFFGVYFGAIYLRSKNIWAVIFLHSILDLSEILFEVLIQPIAAEEITKDITLLDGLPFIAMMLPALILGLTYLRKVDLQKCA